MKTLLPGLIFVACSALAPAQAPDTWTEKNGFGLGIPASQAVDSRSGAVGLATDSTGYVGLAGFQPDFFAFDPATNQFSKKPVFTFYPLYDAAGFAIGDTAYVGTGRSGGYNGTVSFYAYNPAANMWTQLADFGGGDRADAVAFAIGNKGYMGTGDLLWGSGATQVKDFWEYDPATNMWTQKADFGGAARTWAFGFATDTYGFIGGGMELTGFTVYSDFWRYDPVADQWIVRAAFGGGARASAFAMTIDGKGYVGSGAGNGTFPVDFWAYDPATNGWTQKADVNANRREAVAFGIDGIGYMGTGHAPNLAPMNDFWAFDPTMNSWTQVGGFPEYGLTMPVAFVAGNHGYLGTGIFGTTKVQDFWKYDAGADMWIADSLFGGTGRANATGFAIGDKGYICSGTDGTLLKDLWEYDIHTGAWTQKADYGGPATQGPSAFSIGDKGYVGLGFNGSYLKDFWEYDPAVNQWTQRTSFGGVGRYLGIGFSIGGTGYMGAGYATSGTLKNDFWAYDPVTDTWSQKASIPGSGRYRAAHFSLAGKGYVGTGITTGNTKELYEYDPATNAWTKRADFGGAARSSAAGFGVDGKAYILLGDAPGNGGVHQFFDVWEYTPICSTPDTNTYVSGDASIVCDRDSLCLFATTGYTSYQWRKDGVDIAGATTYLCWVKSEGTYACVIASACDTVVTAGRFIDKKPLPSPKITVSGPTMFCKPDSVTLYAIDKPNWSYQWKRNGVPIPGATASSYVVKESGRYKVQVTNNNTGCSKTTGTPVQVKAYSRPAATITPSGTVTFCAGQSALLTANTGNNYSYEWKKNGVVIPGATYDTLTVTDAGIYKVIVTKQNGCSKVSKPDTVVIPCRTVHEGTAAEASGYRVYPNPAGGFVNVFAGDRGRAAFVMYDALFRVVKRLDFLGTGRISLDDLAPGIYRYEIRHEGVAKASGKLIRE